mgnify:FL=1
MSKADLGEGSEFTVDNITSVEYGDEVHFRCQQGMFRYLGARNRRCQQNRELSGEPLICYDGCKCSQYACYVNIQPCMIPKGVISLDHIVMCWLAGTGV